MPREEGAWGTVFGVGKTVVVQTMEVACVHATTAYAKEVKLLWNAGR